MPPTRRRARGAQAATARYGDAMVALRGLRRYIRVWRVRRMRRKADVVRDFLGQLAKNVAVQMQMRRFRSAIVRCQRIVRSFLECCRARRTLLDAQVFLSA